MRRLWLFIGNVVAFCGWPVLFFYLRIGKRTRIVLVSDKSVLVVKGWLSSSKWSLPGGGLHKGENPAIGACRELFEETGLVLAPDKLKQIGQFRGGTRGLQFNYYGFVVHLDQKITPVAKGIEIVEARWLPIIELNQTNADLELLKMLANI